MSISNAIVVFMISACCATSFASGECNGEKLKNNSFDAILNTKAVVNPRCTFIELKDSFAQQGCCSHHQGVCGCAFGTKQCCDGTSSPSCGC